ncbi:MAG: peptidylprolyl isomerase [Enterobacteriaceae bacterium]|nr:peptidylprolyl isomerase [Enterobacteriaceae bacterium]
MKITFFQPIILIQITFILLSTLFTNSGLTKESIIAKVDNEIILQSDLDKYTNIYSLLSSKDINNNLNFNQNLLEDIIINRIQLNIAKKYKIKIDTNRVETVFNKLIKIKNCSIKQYYKLMKEKNVSPKILYEYIKESLTIEELEKILLYQDISMQNYKVSNSNNIHPSKTYIHIKLKNNNKNTSEKLKWITKIINKNYKTKNLSKIIKSKVKTTTINIIKNSPPSKILSIIDKDTQVNIIYKKNNFHFFKIIKTPDKKIHSEFKIKQILIKNKSKIKSKKNTKLTLIRLRDKILNESTFKNREKLYSNNINNIKKEIWINKKSVSKKLYKNIAKLSIGEISYPFKTEIGWHIIKIKDKKYLNKSVNIKEKEILDNKSLEIKNNWLKLIKADAVIEIFHK